MKSHALLLYTKHEQDKCTDQELKDLISLQENCRRKQLLRGLGSSERNRQGNCRSFDSCSSKVPAEVDFLKPTPAKRRKRDTTRTDLSKELKEDLKERLKAERAVIVQEEPGCRMLGVELVCPASSINDICDKATQIHTLQDLSSIYGLRPQFYPRFFVCYYKFYFMYGSTISYLKLHSSIYLYCQILMPCLNEMLIFNCEANKEEYR